MLSQTKIVIAILLILVGGPTSAMAAEKESKKRFNLVGHGGPIKALAINESGTMALTGSFDYSAALWRLDENKSNQLIRRYTNHNGAVNAVKFIQDKKKFISAGDDGSVYIWDLNRDKLIRKFDGHKAKIIALAVSDNGELAASASWDRTVRLWNLSENRPGKVLSGHKGPVNAVLISADGNFAYSGSYDGSIIKWDVESGKLVRTIYRHGWGINVMEWLPGKKQILFGSLNGDVQIFNLKTDSISKVLIPHQRPVLALAVSKDDKYLASGGGDGTIRVWKVEDWSVVEELNSYFGPVWAMDYGADNKTIIYAGLDDFAVSWKVSPRNISAEAQGKYPRRFQKLKNMSLGERQFARKCSICHTLRKGDGNRAGPSLFGVFGRVAGTLKNYKYSKGLIESNIVWNADTIDQLFAIGPQHVTPGSKMPLQKISQKVKRQALIEFLKANTQ